MVCIAIKSLFNILSCLGTFFNDILFYIYFSVSIYSTIATLNPNSTSFLTYLSNTYSGNPALFLFPIKFKFKYFTPITASSSNNS